MSMHITDSPFTKLAPLVVLSFTLALIATLTYVVLPGITTESQVAAVDSALGCSAEHGAINIRDFGAKGDGAIDDTKAFQAAADCMHTLFKEDNYGRAGVSLYVPTGTYKITHPITFIFNRPLRGGGIRLRGDGSEVSIIRSSGDAFKILGIADIKSTRGMYTGIELNDIGFSENGSGGTAIEIDPVKLDLSPLDDGAMYFVLLMSDVDIEGSYAYGLKATGLNLSQLSNVHMKGTNSNTCFDFGTSYGPSIEDSSCSGASIGIDMPRAGEGGTVANSILQNVGTGIHIEVIAGESVGPSNSGGKIVGNKIEARTRGIDIIRKRDVYIKGNTFKTIATEEYQDIRLTNTNALMIADNIFEGGGSKRTGIDFIFEENRNIKGQVRTSRIGTEHTVTGNTFEALGTGIAVATGLTGTVITDNTFSGTELPVFDKGEQTYFKK